MSPERLYPPFLVCGDCRNGLAELGAQVATGVREISAGHACDLHPTSLAVQAQHGIFVEADTVRRWRDLRAAASMRPAPLTDSAASEVARLASRLLSGSFNPDEHLPDDQLVNAVRTAERLLTIAKGG